MNEYINMINDIKNKKITIQNTIRNIIKMYKQNNNSTLNLCYNNFNNSFEIFYNRINYIDLCFDIQNINNAKKVKIIIYQFVYFFQVVDKIYHLYH